MTFRAHRVERAIIPINGVVREVPIGPHTVARFYVQPEREDFFICALCGLASVVHLEGSLYCRSHEHCQGHGPQDRTVASVPELYEVKKAAEYAARS